MSNLTHVDLLNLVTYAAGGKQSSVGQTYAYLTTVPEWSKVDHYCKEGEALAWDMFMSCDDLELSGALMRIGACFEFAWLAFPDHPDMGRLHLENAKQEAIHLLDTLFPVELHEHPAA